MQPLMMQSISGIHMNTLSRKDSTAIGGHLLQGTELNKSANFSDTGMADAKNRTKLVPNANQKPLNVGLRVKCSSTPIRHFLINQENLKLLSLQNSITETMND